LIVACKAANLSWTTVAAILKARFAHHSVSQAELSEANKAFTALSLPSAQRTMRFMMVKAIAAKS
jgi:hypothetical protein